ncbi:MAG: hypothetical protein N3D15_03885 [Syntrophorhabdaceae bacterium]|nr:hypothetical protein [Syntrophorhabdaceae bacterium]
MAVRYIISSVIIYLLTTSPVFSQTNRSEKFVYELSPITSVRLKVYNSRDYEHKKIQMPENYMIVKRPQEEKIYIWEFPVTPKDETPQKQEKESKDKAEPQKETKPTATTSNLIELSRQLGIGENKEATTIDVLKNLLNRELR